MSEQEQPNQPEENQEEPEPQPGGKKGFDTKFFLMVLAFSCIFMLIGQTPLMGLGLFWDSQHGLEGRYSGSGYQGTFSSDVPEGYRDIFLQAGQKWAVQPAFIAAIFYAGEHGESWPPFEEHASLGSALNPKPHNCGSDVGCIRGPMQIGERNWAGWSKGAYGQSTPIERIEWTADAINVATWHLAMLGGGGNTTDPAKILAAAAKYNAGASRPLWKILGFTETRNYVKRVTKAFIKFFQSSGDSIASSSGIVNIARGELGVKEPEAYDKYSNGNPERWCADFVSWVYKQAGYAMNPPRIPAVKNMWSYFENQHQIIPSTGSPVPGDVVFFQWSHVGIVEKVEGDTITYIAGNNSNNAVGRGSISKQQLKGFGHW